MTMPGPVDRTRTMLRMQWLALRERFELLQPREQRFVVAGALVMALAIGWFGVWQPLRQAQATARAALDDAQRTAAEIERLGALARRHPASREGHRRSLLALVDRASRSAELGVLPSRLQPDGDGHVRVWFEHAPFEALVAWLARLQKQDGIAIDAAEITRSDAPGRVDVRLSLVRTQ